MDAERFLCWASTHVGTVRSHNEDSLVNRPDLGLWAVADGAGGHSRGDVASRMVKEALESIPPDLSAGEMLSEVRARIASTHEALIEAAEGDDHKISASTVVVMIVRGDHYACLWAGDSRAYLLRDGQMKQISRDHSLVQEMVDAGALAPEDAETHPQANVITRAVGSDGDFDLDKVTDRIFPGDRFLLCSDGLCKTVPEPEMTQLMALPPEAMPSDRLIESTLAHKGRDNVTAVVVEVLRAAG